MKTKNLKKIMIKNETNKQIPTYFTLKVFQMKLP